MQSTSALYQQIISGWHWKEVKAVIGGVTYKMNTLATLNTQRAAFGTGTPQIGLAVSGSVTITMRGVSSSNIPRMAKIEPFVRVCNATQQSEWLPKGVYYVDTRTESGGQFLTLEGYDTMLRAEQWLDMTNITWPLMDIELVEQIAEQMLFPNTEDDPNYDVSDYIDSRTYTLMDQAFSIPAPSPTEYTGREMLAFLAAMYGGSFIINDSGKLQLVCLWDKPEETFYLLADPDGGGRILIGGNRIILTAPPE